MNLNIHILYLQMLPLEEDHNGKNNSPKVNFFILTMFHKQIGKLFILL